jgi:hypothetical protein
VEILLFYQSTFLIKARAIDITILIIRHFAIQKEIIPADSNSKRGKFRGRVRRGKYFFF